MIQLSQMTYETNKTDRWTKIKKNFKTSALLTYFSNVSYPLPRRGVCACKKKYVSNEIDKKGEAMIGSVEFNRIITEGFDMINLP